MWENKQALLSQSLNLQVFLRDATQAEVLLSQQDNFISKEEVPVSAILSKIMFYHVQGSS